MLIFVFSVYISLLSAKFIKCENEIEETNNEKFKIEGRVSIPNTMDNEWISTTRVLVDGGQYLGFLRSDGSFAVTNVPSGSYIVELMNPMYAFEPMRVDINSKGKQRARRLNHINPSAVETLQYPLKFKAKAKINYFQQREQWRITDMLMNPMVMMMLLPVLVMYVLPKLVNTNDPETQKEMQQSMQMLNPKQNMPDMSDMLTNLFGSSGGSSANKNKASKKSSKKRS